ncbi:hypothetical protein LPJ61_001460 [Coemansia biformis]|uniref:Major facilitator superfamily (MFS) profile domain-containing protein n=1 Tax=Coemansia biformis TaxID=1286918 RepID=A0A9W7YGD3_9FUNG|nr:hypothetical protein LPJ61_001460 [Coemansia biformis]
MTTAPPTTESPDRRGQSASPPPVGGGDGSSSGSGDQRETPLPWSQLGVLLAVGLAEPINCTLILPFLYKLVASFDVVASPRDVSLYASILFTSFCVSQALTSMLWGMLSDRFGRRSTVLIALTGDLATFILFGFSKSFAWALVARSMNGLFSGNTGVVRAIVAEIADDSNRPRMMALMSLTWNAGVLIGAAVGGLLADPVAQYPHIFGRFELLRTFPYLLPCMVGSLTTAIGLVVGLLKLKETLVVGRRKDSRRPAAEESDPATETSPLVGGAAHQTPGPPAQSVLALLTPTSRRVLGAGLLMFLANAMSDQLYPIFAATAASEGGLGFAPRSIGFSLMVAGIAVVYLQLVAYPRLARKHGVLWCYQMGAMVEAPYFFALPCLSLLAAHINRMLDARAPLPLSWEGPWASRAGVEYCLLWALLVALLLVRVVGNVFVYTSINLLVANIAPSKATLGAMSGMQQVAVMCARITGPLVSGALWGWSIGSGLPYPLNSHLVWVIGGSLMVLSWRVSSRLPVSVNTFAAGRDR